MEPKWSVVFPSIHRVEGRKLAGSTFSARSSISDSTQGYVERIYTFSDRVASAPTIAAAAAAAVVEVDGTMQRVNHSV